MNINASIQIVPLGLSSEETTFQAIDQAIDIIKASGLRYEVGPMSTVVEGPYNQVMETFKNAQEATLAVADQVVVNIHLHLDRTKDVTFEHKTEKHKQQ